MTTTPETAPTDAAARLAEIRARDVAATKGPWGSHRDLDGVYTIQARPRSDAYGMTSDGDIATLASGRTDAEGYANASFIAHARKDVPFLLDRVAELEALVKDLTGPECPHGRAHTLFPDTKAGGE